MEDLRSDFLKIENEPLDIINKIYNKIFMSYAATYGRLDLIMFGIENDIPFGKSLCSSACYYGHEHIVRWYLEHVKCKCTFDYKLFIEHAIRQHHEKIVHLLFDPNDRENYKSIFETAFYAKEKDSQIFRYIYTNRGDKLSDTKLTKYIESVLQRRNIEFFEMFYKDNQQLVIDIVRDKLHIVIYDDKSRDWIIQKHIVSIQEVISCIFDKMTIFGIGSIKRIMRKYYYEVIIEMTKRDVNIDRWIDKNDIIIDWQLYIARLSVIARVNKEERITRKIAYIKKEILQLD